MPHVHHLAGPRHFKFDHSLQPALTIEPGDTVVIDCPEGFDGQIIPDSTADVLTGIDYNRLHSLVGPVAVAGAEPGDVLVVEILEFAHQGWGWTCLIPGLGLLADDFGDTHHLHIWKVGSDGRAELRPGIRVPIEPFMGGMGVAPAEAGAHTTIPPRRTGGNMDIRDLCQGSTLYLPVAVPGALFSTGDGHLAQGDGEVCLTAIEAPLTVTLRFGLQKGRSIPEPRYVTSGSVTQRYSGMGYFATTAQGPDLYVNSQNAVRYMIDQVVADYGLSRVEAYMLCSVAGDLKISEIVDSPNWLVSFQMPRSIFVC